LELIATGSTEWLIRAKRSATELQSYLAAFSLVPSLPDEAFRMRLVSAVLSEVREE